MMLDKNAALAKLGLDCNECMRGKTMEECGHIKHVTLRAIIVWDMRKPGRHIVSIPLEDAANPSIEELQEYYEEVNEGGYHPTAMDIAVGTRAIQLGWTKDEAELRSIASPIRDLLEAIRGSDDTV